MPDVVRAANAVVYCALLGMLVQATAPALQAMHAAQHASEQAAADAAAVATHDDLSREAFRSRAPTPPHDDDASGFTCKMCKGHARLGSVLPTLRPAAPDAVGCDGALTVLHALEPRPVVHPCAQPRAPPVLVS